MMMQLKIGSRIVAIKETTKRNNYVYIYGHGKIVATELPCTNAIGYASERAREENNKTFKAKIDENDVGNVYVYATECIFFPEDLFEEVYRDMRQCVQSIETNRYYYQERIKKEEAQKVP
jgi:hypothetical protein